MFGCGTVLTRKRKITVHGSNGEWVSEQILKGEAVLTHMPITVCMHEYITIGSNYLCMHVSMYMYQVTAINGQW